MARRDFLKGQQKQIFHSSIAFCALILTTTLSGSFSLAQVQKQGGIDWIVVIDTSASMRGVGGTKNIFDPVKQTVLEFVNQAQIGDTVAVYTFDRDTSLRSNITIQNNVDRGNLKKIIEDIQADGDRTHTGKAVQDALSYSASLNERPNAQERTVSILFLTDGLEDIRGIPNAIPIPDNIQLAQEQNCKPYVFFVSLGETEHEKQLDEFINNPAFCDRGQVIRDPGATTLIEQGNRIRQLIQQPVLDLQIEPKGLNFGAVKAGETTPLQSLKIRSNHPTKVQIQLQDENSEVALIEPSEAVTLNPDNPTDIPIRLQTNPEASAGDRKLSLILTPIGNNGVQATPLQTEVNLNIFSPLWQRLLWLLLPLILIGSGILGAMRLIYSPGKLEGELELLYPEPRNMVDEVVSLRRQKRQRVQIQDLFSGQEIQEFLGSSNAELRPLRKNGQKTIQLRRLSGTVSVNDIEVATADIYDGDKIEVGNVSFKFNSLSYAQSLSLSGYDEFV